MTNIDQIILAAPQGRGRPSRFLKPDRQQHDVTSDEPRYAPGCRCETVVLVDIL